MKKIIKGAACAVCVIAIAAGCSTGVFERSETTGATTFTAMNPPVKNTARVVHVRSGFIKKASAAEYRLDLSAVQEPYAKEIEYYTEKALAFNPSFPNSGFSALKRNDSSDALTIKVSLTFTTGASGRRGTRYRACYTISAIENGAQIWTVRSSCKGVFRDFSKINGWLPGLVASASAYFGQNRGTALHSPDKHPEFLAAIGAL